MDSAAPAEPPASRPHAGRSSSERLARAAWRFLVIAAAVVTAVWLVRQVWLVLVPLVVAALLARILVVPAHALRRRGCPPVLAAIIAFLASFAVLAGGVAGLGALVADEFGDVGPSVEAAIDDIEEWLVEDSPFDINRARLEEIRSDLAATLGDAVRGSGSTVASGAVLAAELAVALFVAVVIAFYAVKDGDRFTAWVLRRLPPSRRDPARRAGRAAWHTLGGFLRGAALLGVVEGLAIGITLFLVGAGLAVPMAIITFAAAFVPFVGAIVAGVLAVLVTLATGGVGATIVVAIVVLVLQQLDNELLAPIVYGKTLELHPVTILLGIALGGAVFGVAGSVLAVPVTAVAAAVINELSHTTTADSTGEVAAAAGEPRHLV